jgi:hypothetical protein
MGLICLNTFWDENIIHEDYYYLLADLLHFKFEFLVPVATHGHSSSTIGKGKFAV